MKQAVDQERYKRLEMVRHVGNIAYEHPHISHICCMMSHDMKDESPKSRMLEDVTIRKLASAMILNILCL